MPHDESLQDGFLLSKLFELLRSESGVGSSKFGNWGTGDLSLLMWVALPQFRNFVDPTPAFRSDVARM